ncbi:MAG TPA: hypothetical protein VLH85_08250 [Levilinea sp.]|nr:hypothetical protein [Levilinea sp.]
MAAYFTSDGGCLGIGGDPGGVQDGGDLGAGALDVLEIIWFGEAAQAQP